LGVAAGRTGVKLASAGGIAVDLCASCSGARQTKRRWWG
jgi:hypothetical protein